MSKKTFMTCYSPLHGWRSREVNSSGKRSITFNKKAGYIDLPVTLPCGGCIGCRLERARQWAVRCYHEASINDQNAFITLTYNDDNLPNGGTLNLRHFQLFMKRLRKLHSPKTIRFFHCGEYGANLLRPHYHACIFGHDFEDRTLWKTGKYPQYRSAELESLWTVGHSITQDLTFQSASYTARYILKKVTGKNADDHYWRYDERTGEIYTVIPEYVTMSRRPGIGTEWFITNKSDCYPSDFLVINNKKQGVPTFYDRSYELTNATDLIKIKRSRRSSANLCVSDTTPDRLKVREKVKIARLKQLPERNL